MDELASVWNLETKDLEINKIVKRIERSNDREISVPT